MIGIFIPYIEQNGEDAAVKTRDRRRVPLLALLALTAVLLGGCGEFPRLDRLMGEEPAEAAALEISLNLAAPEEGRAVWEPSGDPAEGVETAVGEDASGDLVITIRIPRSVSSQRR